MLKGVRVRRFLLSFFILFFGSASLFALSSNGNDGVKNNLAYVANSPSISAKKLTLFSQLQPVFTFTAGVSISQPGQSQSFAPLDLCNYSYKPKGSNTNSVLWGGFIGDEIKQTSSWGLIAGIGYYEPTSFSTKGTLTQGVDPESDSIYQYKYQTQSQQLLAEGKLYWMATKRIYPFLMLGVGAAFNKVYHYQTNVPPFYEFTPDFSNRNQTNFTYAVGPGVDVKLSDSFRVGVGYRFTDLGSANTGSGEIDTIPIPNKLKKSHLYANQILAQLTFIPQTH